MVLFESSEGGYVSSSPHQRGGGVLYCCCRLCSSPTCVRYVQKAAAFRERWRLVYTAFLLPSAMLPVQYGIATIATTKIFKKELRNTPTRNKHTYTHTHPKMPPQYTHTSLYSSSWKTLRGSQYPEGRVLSMVGSASSLRSPSAGILVILNSRESTEVAASCVCVRTYAYGVVGRAFRRRYIVLESPNQAGVRKKKGGGGG